MSKKEELVEEITAVEVISSTEEAEDTDLAVEFKRQYKFEGKTYSSIDLSGLENLRGIDMIEADRIFQKSGNVEFLREANMEYTFILAAKVTAMPIEFFQNLYQDDARAVKTKVTGFLFKKD